jgi:GNAT superfamily N-acetyltransferase
VLYDLQTEAADARDFAVVEDGKPVSFALLFSDGVTGMIEDVATLDAYRKRGLSRAVVTKALEVSRREHDFTFLIADDRDWPKEFYSKLGFDVLGRHFFFLRTPPP